MLDTPLILVMLTHQKQVKGLHFYRAKHKSRPARPAKSAAYGSRQTDGRHAIPRPRICTKVHCAVKTGPARSKKPALAEQKRPENRHWRPRAPTPLYTFEIFLFVLWSYLSNLLFLIFFGRSGPVRELVPSYRSLEAWRSAVMPW